MMRRGELAGPGETGRRVVSYYHFGFIAYQGQTPSFLFQSSFFPFCVSFFQSGP
jgi:hypothetical protein